MSDKKQISLDRLPPFSLEAEQGVLGCCLTAPAGALNECEESKVAMDWFYDLRHQCVFNVLRALREAGKPVDMISVSQVLRDGGQLDEVGGIAYLMELQDCIPSAANLPHYLGIVRAKYLLRRLIRTATDVVARAYEFQGADAEVLLHQAEEGVAVITDQASSQRTEKSMAELVPTALEEMEKNYKRGSQQMRGLPTGLDVLDKIIRGIREEYYMVLAGRPADGKTSLALNIVKHVALDYQWWSPRPGQVLAEGAEPEMEEHVGVPVGIFSIEMSDTSLVQRLLYEDSRVDSGLFEQGYALSGDFERLTKTALRLKKAPIYIDATPAQSIGQIAAKARRWAVQYGIKLFVLDYIQLVEVDHGSGADRVRELAKISRKIMALKKQLKIPWLVLAQMNRNIETAEVKRAPVLSDLKDCGAIEQDADVVALLYKPARNVIEDDVAQIKGWMEQQNAEWKKGGMKGPAPVSWSAEPQRVNVLVAKNRYGPSGKAECVFLKNLCRFEDWHIWKVKHEIEAEKKGERPGLFEGEPEGGG